MPPNSVPFDVPIAFSTAMSRERSSAVRYTIVATMPAAISQSSVLKIATVCVPDFCGRFRSSRTSAALMTCVPAGAVPSVPRTAIAVAYGWPCRKFFCTSPTVRNTVGCPK